MDEKIGGDGWRDVLDFKIDDWWWEVCYVKNV